MCRLHRREFLARHYRNIVSVCCIPYIYNNNHGKEYNSIFVLIKFLYLFKCTIYSAEKIKTTKKQQARR